MLERLAKTRYALNADENSHHRNGIMLTLMRNKPLYERIARIGDNEGRGADHSISTTARMLVLSAEWHWPAAETDHLQTRLKILDFAKDVSTAWSMISASSMRAAGIPRAFFTENSHEQRFYGPTLFSKAMSAAGLADIVRSKLRTFDKGPSAYREIFDATILPDPHESGDKDGFVCNLRVDVQSLEDQVRAIACELAIGYSELF